MSAVQIHSQLRVCIAVGILPKLLYDVPDAVLLLMIEDCGA